jgi:antitoxin MazE
MQTAIAKWGNSLALRLPQAIAAEARLHEGSAVDIRIEGSVIVVRPARPRYDLKELLAGYRDEHRHDEEYLGAPIGDELL